ncbi:hypothetical protein PVAND_001490 [Polypedilum vanderplanki]|uniref:Uncharacterized protein n=1 Tax=Polypedilum vanderplanki TaxID=319348 RepID=A0A9J6BNK9_POLVA|nr:hypothetical protein PVAND_001490 [Polypedilum vanderplanki]
MLNFSITTDDFLDIINEFKTRASPFYFVIGFNQAFSSFSFVSNIITEKNLCKNYNLAPSIDVFNTNLTADDFNYQHYNDIKECLFQNFTIISLQRSLTSKTFLTTRMLTYEAQRKETISSTKGGSMFFHDPYELHTKFSQNYVINEHQNVEIIIEPQIMEVDESLYDENPISRNCYFDDERKLKLFKVYTKANCQFECMSELMITRCGCVEFFMIRNKTTRICSASEKVCFDKVRKEFDGYLSNCGCLERCNFVKYNIEFNSHDRNLKDLHSGYGDGMLYTDSLIKYKSIFINKFLRKKQFNEIDFLSFVGGLLGLFAGFSVLSTVEIFFWLFKKIFGSKSNVVQPLSESQKDFLNKFNTLGDFLNNSSIHGVNYLTQSNFKYKLFWTFFITISLTLCAFMIKNIQKQTWTKSYDDNYNFKDKVLFPAVTFIPSYYADLKLHKLVTDQKKRIKNIKFLQETFNENITKQFECIHLIQDKYFRDDKSRKPLNLEFIRLHSKVDYFKQQFATWNDKFQVNFTEIRTIYGLGFSFNLLDSKKLLHYKEFVF